MLARPLAAGMTYFNAALKSGYNYMFIDTGEEIYGQGSTFSWRRDFDTKSRYGLIGGTIKSYNSEWYFCKEK